MAKGPKKDDKDHLADALSALSKGEHREEPPQGSGMEGHAHAHADLGGQAGQAPPVPQPQPVAKPPRPASVPPRPSAPRPPPQRPISPGQPVPPAAAPGPVPPPSSGMMRPSTPTAKARPGTPGQGLPGIPQRPPAHRVQAHGAPQPSFAVHDDSHEEEIAREAEAVAHVVEDDDTINMPTPSAEMISHRRPPPPRHRAHLARTVGFKQTLIPVLLTLGLLLPGIAAWSFALGEESPVAAATWIPLALLGIGAVMLVFAAVTMMQVKHQLEEGKRPM